MYVKVKVITNLGSEMRAYEPHVPSWDKIVECHSSMQLLSWQDEPRSQPLDLLEEISIGPEHPLLLLDHDKLVFDQMMMRMKKDMK